MLEPLLNNFLAQGKIKRQEFCYQLEMQKMR